MTRLEDFLRAYEALYWTDKILAILIISISALLAIAFLFAWVVVGLRVKNAQVRKRWFRLEAEWAEKLLDVLSGDMDVETMRSLIRPEDQLRFVSFLQRFSRSLRGSELQLLRDLAAPYLPEIAKQLGSPTAERRARAVMTLSGLGGDAYLEDVLSSLDDESALVAMVAARAVASSGHVEQAGRIMDHIERFDRWSPRHLAAMFAAMGMPAAPSLRATLANALAPERARVVAAEALLILKDFEAAEAARQVVSGWATPNVLVAALRLLTATGNEQDAAEARRLVRSQHSAVRGAAVTALGSLGDASDIATIEAFLADENPWVTLNAAAALRELGATDRLMQIASGGHAGSHAARELLERAGA